MSAAKGKLCAEAWDAGDFRAVRKPGPKTNEAMPKADGSCAMHAQAPGAERQNVPRHASGPQDCPTGMLAHGTRSHRTDSLGTMQGALDPTCLRIDVPAWMDELVDSRRGSLTTPESRMDLAIALSRGSVEHGGSPFGAVVCAGDE